MIATSCMFAKPSNLSKLSLVVVLSSMMFVSGCSNESDGFSILSEQNVFRQSADYEPRPVDILWVVDNSFSMENSQTALATNFQSFIQQFSSLGYDFRMAVGTTDAYLKLHYNNDARARFKQGRVGDESGVYVMDKDTPQLQTVFQKNIRVGIDGFSDERPLESMKQLLSNSLNSDFRRPGAYLVVIIVSDEEDTSHYDWYDGTNSYFLADNPADARLFNIATNPIHATFNPQHGYHTPEFYKNYLDQLTGGNSTVKNYAVNSIVIKDQACKDALAENSQKISQRMVTFAEMTGGQAFSLCEPFNGILDSIQADALKGANTFRLNREPIVATILVRVNGATIPQDPVNGWSYDAASNSVIFNSGAIPPADSVISIDFDPAGVAI